MILTRVFPVFLLLTAGALAQSFDTSGNALLKGTYLIREVLIRGQNSSLGITSAVSATGLITFDGAGNYSFTGPGQDSTRGAIASRTLNGTYKVNASGMVVIQSLADPTDSAYGGVGAVGPNAFVASATEGDSVDMLVAVPAGSGVTTGALRGTYTIGALDFPNADINLARQAVFSPNFDGSGGIAGATAVTGNAVNLGGSPTSQTLGTTTYSLTANGTGTLNFGTSSVSQLVSGTRNLYLSADGNLFIAGNPAGYDLMVGVRGFAGSGSNASASGVYYISAMEDLPGSGAGAGDLDAFYGSVNFTGSGTGLYHNRFQSFVQPVYDFTFSSQFSVPANGVFAPSDVPYQFSLGTNGQAFVATGTRGLYSLMIGLKTIAFPASGIFINPLGIVNSASFAPITNPIAPGEFITIFGSNLATSTAQAASLPLPQSLGGVQVQINGVNAPLSYASATQITALVPAAISPASNANNATIRVVRVNAPGQVSNPVTVYTNLTAPGVFTVSGAIGPAAAQHANFSLITANNPAKTGESVILYASGLGAVTPAVADGAPAGSSPLSTVNAQPLYVDFGSASLVGTIAFAGLTPTAAGLYQFNVQIPAGTSGTPYVDVSTPDAYTSQATLNVMSAQNPETVENHQMRARQARAAAAKNSSRANTQKLRR